MVRLELTRPDIDGENDRDRSEQWWDKGRDRRLYPKLVVSAHSAHFCCSCGHFLWFVPFCIRGPIKLTKSWFILQVAFGNV